jgi:hypothetical protein
LASKDNTSQHVFWAAILFFLQISYTNSNVSRTNIAWLALWQSGRLQRDLGLVRNPKRFLFVGLAFALVTILIFKIRKPNGVSGPGFFDFSPRPS